MSYHGGSPLNSKGNPSNHSNLMAGQHHLYEELKETKTGCLGARAAKRLITDCYSRAVVRVAVESTKLILDSQHNNPMHAESIKTAQVTEISLHFPIKMAPDTKIEQAQPHEQKTDELAQRCRIARHGPSMGDNEASLPESRNTGWWFQICFMFTPT